MTNTALKGIIGVKAMAEIAHALGEDADAAEYGVSGCWQWVYNLSELVD